MSKKKKKNKMLMVPIEFINERAVVPQYKTDGSSGMDVITTIEDPVVLKPLERFLFPTGIVVAVPKGYEIQVRPRSGKAINEGFTVLNTPGTIDSDYRGELGVVGINLSNEDVTVMPNERVAQIIFNKVKKAKFFETKIVDNPMYSTNRGNGGYGHTGKFDDPVNYYEMALALISRDECHIPEPVINDVRKRLEDWIGSGGAVNDDYCKKQYEYLVRVDSSSPIPCPWSSDGE